MRRGARALFAVHQATVPWVSVLVRKVYGVAGAAHGDALAAEPPLRLAVGRLGLAADRRRARGRLPARARGGRGPGRAARGDRGAARRGALAVPDRRALRRRGDHRPARHAPAAVRVGAPGSPARRPRGGRRAEGARAAARELRYRARSMTEHAFHADGRRRRRRGGPRRATSAARSSSSTSASPTSTRPGRIAGARHIELERLAVAGRRRSRATARRLLLPPRRALGDGGQRVPPRRLGRPLDGRRHRGVGRARPPARARGRACRGSLGRCSRSPCSRSPRPAGAAAAPTLEPVGDFDAPIVRRPRRRATPSRLFVVERAGRGAGGPQRHDARRRRSSTSPAEVRRPTASAACSRSPSRPTTRASGLFYVYLTAEPRRRAAGARVPPLGGDPDRADPTGRIVWRAAARRGRNHNGGQVEFGPDGMLWFATGDGGGSNDGFGHARDLAQPARQAAADRSASRQRAAATRSRPATRSAPRCGRTACATRSASPSTAARATSFIGDVGQDAARGDRLGALRRGPRARRRLRLGVPGGHASPARRRARPGANELAPDLRLRADRQRAPSPAATSCATRGCRRCAAATSTRTSTSATSARSCRRSPRATERPAVRPRSATRWRPSARTRAATSTSSR